MYHASTDKFSLELESDYLFHHLYVLIVCLFDYWEKQDRRKDVRLRQGHHFFNLTFVLSSYFIFTLSQKET